MVESIKNNDLKSFRNKYIKISELEIFNIEDIINKSGTTRELREILNSRSTVTNLSSIYSRDELLKKSKDINDQLMAILDINQLIILVFILIKSLYVLLQMLRSLIKLSLN